MTQKANGTNISIYTYIHIFIYSHILGHTTDTIENIQEKVKWAWKSEVASWFLKMSPMLTSKIFTIPYNHFQVSHKKNEKTCWENIFVRDINLWKKRNLVWYELLWDSRFVRDKKILFNSWGPKYFFFKDKAI